MKTFFVWTVLGVFAAVGLPAAALAHGDEGATSSATSAALAAQLKINQLSPAQEEKYNAVHSRLEEFQRNKASRNGSSASVPSYGNTRSSAISGTGTGASTAAGQERSTASGKSYVYKHKADYQNLPVLPRLFNNVR